MRLLPIEVELSRSARRTLSLAAFTGTVGLFPRFAAADDAVRLDYLAPVGCPDHLAFIDRVRQRVPTARAASPDELARELTVVVGEDEDGFSARLDFVDRHGETITRTLSGKTCDEVVTGIALVTALALEAQHETEAAEGHDAESPAPVGAPESAPPAEDTTPAPPAPATRATAAPTPRAPSSRPTAKRRAKARRGFRNGAGIGAGNAWFVAPGTPIVMDAAFRVGHSSITGSGRVGFRSWVSKGEVGVRTASFIGYTGALEGCPVAWPKESALRFEPCLALTLGVLEARGEPTEELLTTDSSRIFWGDVRGIARVRVALTDIVELEGQGELGVPLRTHRFLFQSPEQTVFEIPGAGIGWRAGILLHFP
jgi:hypothetical protein